MNIYYNLLSGIHIFYLKNSSMISFYTGTNVEYLNYLNFIMYFLKKIY